MKEEVFLTLIRHGHSDRSTQDNLTPAGIMEIEKTAEKYLQQVSPGDTVLLLYSPTTRTTQTATRFAQVIEKKNQATSRDDAQVGSVVIETTPLDDLLEVVDFDFSLFICFVNGGQLPAIYCDEGNYEVIKAIWNPKNLTPEEYYRASGWQDVCMDELEKLPTLARAALEKIERYEYVQLRMNRIVQKIMRFIEIRQSFSTSENTNGNLHIVLSTHDALLMWLIQEVTNGQITNVKTAGAIVLRVESSQSQLVLYAQALLNIRDNEEQQFDLAKHDLLAALRHNESKIFPEGHTQVYRSNQLSVELKEKLLSFLMNDLKESVLQATNLGDFDPDLSNISDFEMPKWLVLQRGKRVAIAYVYKGYRFYFSGDQELIEEMVQQLDKGIPINLPRYCTFVMSKRKWCQPKHWRIRKERTKHDETPERPNAYSRRLMISSNALEQLQSEEEDGSGNVRKLTADDWDAVKQLFSPPDDYTGNHEGEYSDEVVIYENRFKALPYFGYFENGKLIGVVGAQGLHSKGHFASIGDAFVLHESRKKGIATKMITSLIRYLVNQKAVNQIFADIRIDKATKKVFEKIGFVDIRHSDIEQEIVEEWTNKIGNSWKKDEPFLDDGDILPGASFIRIGQLERKVETIFNLNLDMSFQGDYPQISLFLI